MQPPPAPPPRPPRPAVAKAKPSLRPKRRRRQQRPAAPWSYRPRRPRPPRASERQRTPKRMPTTRVKTAPIKTRLLLPSMPCTCHSLKRRKHYRQRLSNRHSKPFRTDHRLRVTEAAEEPRRRQVPSIEYQWAACTRRVHRCTPVARRRPPPLIMQAISNSNNLACNSTWVLQTTHRQRQTQRAELQGVCQFNVAFFQSQIIHFRMKR